MKDCKFCEAIIDENKVYLIIVKLDQAPKFAHKDCFEEIAVDTWFHDHLE
jgi:hypothetical protein